MEESVHVKESVCKEVCVQEHLLQESYLLVDSLTLGWFVTLAVCVLLLDFKGSRIRIRFSASCNKNQLIRGHTHLSKVVKLAMRREPTT